MMVGRYDALLAELEAARKVCELAGRLELFDEESKLISRLDSALDAWRVTREKE